MEIVSERADFKPTLMGVITRGRKIFVDKMKQKYVLIVGDAKSICYEYKSHLKWLTPFPGDWKPYADAGLASLAKVAGHKGETLTSLLQASNFRRTHEFLLQVFEVMYHYFLSMYYSHVAARRPSEQRKHFEEDISLLA